MLIGTKMCPHPRQQPCAGHISTANFATSPLTQRHETLRVRTFSAIPTATVHFFPRPIATKDVFRRRRPRAASQIQARSTRRRRASAMENFCARHDRQAYRPLPVTTFESAASKDLSRRALITDQDGAILDKLAAFITQKSCVDILRCTPGTRPRTVILGSKSRGHCYREGRPCSRTH